jgi:hypothetical protein
MPKVNFNPLLAELSATLDDTIFRTSAKGDVANATYPDQAKMEWSESQKEQYTLFKQATEYARMVMSHPNLRTIYEEKAAEEQQGPHVVAFIDYLTIIDLLSKK